MKYGWVILCVALVFSDCTIRDKQHSGAAAQLKQAEPLPFPRYLLPEGFELGPYGRILGTSSYAIEIRGPSSLRVATRLYKQILTSNHWNIDETERKRRSVWIKASKPRGSLEIRGVQGIGITSLFLIYSGNEGEIR